jgi:hypothetical protein
VKSYNAAVAITPSDTANFGRLTDAIWVGGAGVVVAVLQNGTTASFTCAAGALLPVKVTRVNSTNTTATLLVALNEV